MIKNFQGRVVLLAGATGALGGAVAQAFADNGAQLILAGRDAEKLQRLERKFSAPAFQVDFSSPKSITYFRDEVRARFPQLDVVVNIAGADIRKPLTSHTDEEIQRLLSINLAASITLTRDFLPLMNPRENAVILHVGGFADGRLAFPFYSVDAASRAGLAAFIESVNRELRLEKSSVRLVYFSPSPADTEAERPFHGIWREMGLEIESPARVADALLQALSAQRERYLMGGVLTEMFARLNSALPRLADVLMMDQYSLILKKHFGGQIP